MDIDTEALRAANRARWPELARIVDRVRESFPGARVRPDPADPGMPCIRDHSTLPPEVYDRLKASGVWLPPESGWNEGVRRRQSRRRAG